MTTILSTDENICCICFTEIITKEEIHKCIYENCNNKISKGKYCTEHIHLVENCTFIIKKNKQCKNPKKYGNYCVKHVSYHMTTDCNHIYHKNCIDQWKEHGDSCPICRQPFSKITNDYHNNVIESTSWSFKNFCNFLSCGLI
jgi:hypothetical protein